MNAPAGPQPTFLAISRIGIGLIIQGHQPDGQGAIIHHPSTHNGSKSQAVFFGTIKSGYFALRKCSFVLRLCMHTIYHVMVVYLLAGVSASVWRSMLTTKQQLCALHLLVLFSISVFDMPLTSSIAQMTGLVQILSRLSYCLQNTATCFKPSSESDHSSLDHSQH